MTRGTGLPLDGDRLRAARAAAHLTQAALAQRVGTSRHKILRYEAGKERPEAARLAALARALDVGVADLVVEGALPTGLARPRAEAGLTLAAAAAAMRARVPAESSVACSRFTLAAAERGELPPTWSTPAGASVALRALGGAYSTTLGAMVDAWTEAFGGAIPLMTWGGSRNPTSNEAPTETAPTPVAGPPRTAMTVWGSKSRASQPWHIRARLRTPSGEELAVRAAGVEGQVPTVAWVTETSPARVVHGQVLEAIEWTSPWRSSPDLRPNLPTGQPARELLPGEEALFDPDPRLVDSDQTD